MFCVLAELNIILSLLKVNVIILYIILVLLDLLQNLLYIGSTKTRHIKEVNL